MGKRVIATHISRRFDSDPALGMWYWSSGHDLTLPMSGREFDSPIPHHAAVVQRKDPTLPTSRWGFDYPRPHRISGWCNGSHV